MVNTNNKNLIGEGLSLLQLKYSPALIIFLQTLPKNCYRLDINEWSFPLNMFYRIKEYLDDGNRGCFGASFRIISFESFVENHSSSQPFIALSDEPRIKLRIKFDLSFNRYIANIPNTTFNCHTNEWTFPTSSMDMILLEQYPSVIVLESPHITTIKHITSRKQILVSYPYEFGQFRHFGPLCEGLGKDQILLPDDLLNEIKSCLYENELKFVEFPEWDDNKSADSAILNFNSIRVD
jgi:hypothetical protein